MNMLIAIYAKEKEKITPENWSSVSDPSHETTEDSTLKFFLNSSK